MNTDDKTGGAVALYVDRILNYNVVEKMTIVIGSLLECVTTEICMENKKKIGKHCIKKKPLIKLMKYS